MGARRGSLLQVSETQVGKLGGVGEGRFKVVVILHQVENSELQVAQAQQWVDGQAHVQRERHGLF